jgi:hypothetical protein
MHMSYVHTQALFACTFPEPDVFVTSTCHHALSTAMQLEQLTVCGLDDGVFEGRDHLLAHNARWCEHVLGCCP